MRGVLALCFYSIASMQFYCKKAGYNGAAKLSVQ